MNEEEMLIYTSGAQPMVLDSVLDISQGSSAGAVLDIEKGGLEVGGIMVSCPMVNIKKGTIANIRRVDVNPMASFSREKECSLDCERI